MKNFEKFMTRKLTRAESNMFCVLVMVVGMLIAVLAMRANINGFLTESNGFWLGFYIMLAGGLGLLAPSPDSGR